MSMRWRLFGAFALVIIIALGTIAVVTRYTTEQEVQRFLGYGGQVGLENLARTLENYYADNGSWSGIVSSPAAMPGRGQGQRGSGMAGIGSHILVDANGVVVYSPREDEIGVSLSDQQLSQSINLEVSGELVGYLIPEGGIPELPDNFEGLLIERVNRATLLAALVSGGIAILLALVLATIILKPVRDLTAAARKMSAGDLSQRVEVQGKGEINALGQTFNKMAESLQDAEVRRRAMTADIAHELRNPLAIQRAHLEALQDGVYPLNSESLEPIAEQNQQLTRLVEDLRTLALADAGSLDLNKRKIDLIEVCRDTVKRFEPQTLGKNIKLFTDCQLEGLLVEADKERLQQILDNLMQNAIRYTPEAGRIRLTLLREGGFGVFKIHNNGPQLSEQALKRLFERFYRAEKARDRASGGTGLGLAIARQLAETHGGSLDGANHPDGGVVFTLTLPLIPG
ncbi:MAG: Two-component sensor histidine kinase [Anaerolinea thermophila]|uniref:Signal transduction histidine-protein kinase/phosphatase MprB n=1 Tax=Anaerolinea thermophila TaxID=167964 RepID=A0A124FMU8_9CHLR|nr:MAG: Two-component sensor histidine kinase [Anaerolinea thermophila]